MTEKNMVAWLIKLLTFEVLDWRFLYSPTRFLDNSF